MKRFSLLILILALMGSLFATQARAVPSLQLDIQGGSYDLSTQTIMASGNTFSLYAYGTGNKVSLSDSFYLSIALLPQTSLAGNYGSFLMNGTTFNVTSDMVYGNPPLESIVAHDGGDLGPHGIFPTYFAEVMFNFSAANQSAIYNTQDEAGSGPQAGSGMYYKRFDFDIAGLAPGYGLHFDLYNVKLKRGGDIDVDFFAPFSHDAGAMVTTPIPEPEIYAMMALGLGFVGWAGRRRRQGSALN